jgi:2-polyprenyl-3-methyl-5-hydroxy-6-metoxy-1,4-benzoquinol methylase
MTTLTQSELPSLRAGGLEPIESELFAALQARIEGLLPPTRPIQVLDAGCGHRLYVPIADDRYVVGIDIEPAQLRDDLNEAIVGDLQTYDLGRDRFDAVICWNVLEHVADPPLVIGKFIDALRPGGIAILAMPHVASVKGLVTKYTPHWFHGWVWRHLLGAGPSHEEFPTVLSRSLAPARLQRLARDTGLSVEFLAPYEAWPQKKIRRKLRLGPRAFGALSRAVAIVSLGRVTIAATDVIVVLRKPGA